MTGERRGSRRRLPRSERGTGEHCLTVPPGKKMVKERVHHGRARRAARRVDDHAGRLVEHEDPPVLVQHREGQVLRLEAGGLRRRDLEVDPLAAAEAGGGPGRSPLEVHQALAQQALHPRPRKVGGEPRHGDVEPEAPEILGDGEGAAIGRARRRHQIFDFTCPFALRITSTMARS